MGKNESSAQMTEKLAVLEKSSERLKSANNDILNSIDLLRTSVIEVFACVQDVKSKLFQFTNPG